MSLPSQWASHGGDDDLHQLGQRLREWLKDNGPSAATPATERQFRAALYDAGFVGVDWPVEYGGRGLGAEHQKVVDEELRPYSHLMVRQLVTMGICAPTLLDFGSEIQKRRHLPPMLRGDEAWTQLLSEPGAGSDLAGLQTSAVRDGDEWVVNGQKVWTSGAQECEFAVLIARTNPDVPKHAGLSMFIVDLHARGVTIRPLRQMTGASDFNEVFLDDVRLPEESLVGEKDDGWRAVTRMLMHERMAIGAGTGGSRMGHDRFESLLMAARRRNLTDDAVVRDMLVTILIQERILGWIGQRMRAAAAAGRPPGPEGSIAKLANSILAKASSNAGMHIHGPAAQAWDPAADGAIAPSADFLQAPMTAIAGGTSEIQRNTIAERVLGLPKEPAIDRGIPYREVRKNRPHSEG